MAYIGKSPALGNFVKLDAISVVNGQAAYTMQNGSVNFTDYESVNQFLVSLNGTIQAPTSSFTVSGSTLTFASNLSTGDVIDFIMVFGNSLSAGTPTDATVTSAKLSGALVTPSTLDVNGNELILDADADTSITADTDDQIDFKTAGSDRMSIIADGKVGIGTTSPTRELTVGNTANARIEILSSDNSAGASQLQFGDPDNSQIGRIYYEHSDNSMRFHTNNTEELRILSGGGITFNGDTAAANALDDYEEGSFTPNFKLNNTSSGISATQVGKYTKVGNLVTLQIFIELSNKGSSSGSASIHDLPFTIETLTASWSGVGTAPLVWHNMASSLVQAGVTVNRSSQILTLFGHTASNGNGTNQALTNTDFANNSYFGITVTYQTT